MFRELALLAPAHPLAPGGELGGGEPRVRPRPLTPGGLSEEGLHAHLGEETKRARGVGLEVSGRLGRATPRNKKMPKKEM